MFTHVPETLLDWALVVAGGSTFIIFVVALQNFFVQPPALTRGQRLFQEISVLLGVTHGLALLVLHTAGEVWAAAGIAMYSVALAVFLSAIEAARRVSLPRTFVYEPRTERILTTGPFRYIRHPMYLSYSLAWLAAPVAMHSVVLALTAVGMIACYVVSAAEEERRLRAGPLGEEYERYAAATKRIIPFVF